jgi:hypothetical protein
MTRDRARFLRFGIGAACVVLVLALGAFAANRSSGAAPRGRGTVTVTFGDKGSTVGLHVGATLRVVLDSTYWSMNPSPNPGVLAPHGAATTVPRSGCVPGEGCGTVTALFLAHSSGTISISASRTSCGEALRCTNGDGSFQVTVHVE